MKTALFIIIYLAILSSCIAQNESLKICIDKLKNDHNLKQNSWSFCAYNCANKKIIADYHSDSLLTPASVTKIFSTASAFDNLGENFRYETKIIINEQLIKNGKYNGDLWIVGSGDPTIGLDYFSATSFTDSVYKFLKTKNIDTITGNIIGLSAKFDSIIIPSTYLKDDYGNYYGAGTSALIWNVNKLELTFAIPSTFGAKAKLKSTFPSFDNFDLQIEATAGEKGSGDNSIIWGGPFNFNRKITGTLPPNQNEYKVFASSPDPALGFSIALKYFLTKKNIICQGICLGKYNGEIPCEYKTTYIFHSPKLKNIIEYVNTKSNNIGAETMMKTVACDKYGIGTWEKSYLALNNFITKTIGDTLPYKIFDGSGLSKANKLSTKMITQFLSNIMQYGWFDSFYKTLPLAGKTGSLRTMFRGSSVEGKLRAKSGYMKTVRAYSGYVENIKGQTIAFAIIANDYAGNSQILKKNIEQLMISLSISE